ncbi:hypothetical protein LJR231_000234 [Phyllobacterium sp. LjRoot231]|uniref:S10 family serine carboxypeptidase-like protein n=1 Tax=Phyllobacterium sp. LjRoot231 TaxID=3342289 RepID=UPI003ECE8F10
MNFRNSSLALLLFLTACNGSNSSTPQTDTTQIDTTGADSTFADLAKAKDELATVTAQKSLTQAGLDDLNNRTTAAKQSLDEKNAELAVLKGDGQGSIKESGNALEALKRQAEAAQKDIDAKAVELDNLTRTDPGNLGLIALKAKELSDKQAELNDLIRIDPVNPGPIPKAEAELKEKTAKLAILNGDGDGSIKAAEAKRDKFLNQIAGLTTDAAKLTARNRALELKAQGDITGAADVLAKAGLTKEAAEILMAGGFRKEAAEVLRAGGFKDESDALLRLVEAETPKPAANSILEDKTSYAYEANSSLALEEVRETSSVKLQEMTIKNKLVKYTARAGHLTAYAPKDPAKPDVKDAQATIFYMAYTRDDLPKENRPVTFFWNGGPGSSSIFLHMGSWAPKRLFVNIPTMTPESKITKPASFPWIDDDETLLEHSDLVFVDPVGTGFSQAIAPHTNTEFWGMDEDARIERDFITRFINVYNRQSSPKYLYGESYGGIRTPIVARMLVEAGTRDFEKDNSGKPAKILTGIVLNSPVLDYESNTGLGGDTSNAGFLPTEAMSADYYKKASKRQKAPAIAYVDTLRNFVRNEYAAGYRQWYYPTRSAIKAAADNAPAASQRMLDWYNAKLWQFVVGRLNITTDFAEAAVNWFVVNPVDRPKAVEAFGTDIFDVEPGLERFVQLALDAEKEANSPAWLKYTKTPAGIDLLGNMKNIMGLDVNWINEFEMSSKKFQESIMPDLSLNPYDTRINVPKGAYDLTFYEDDAFAAGIENALTGMFNYQTASAYKTYNFDVIGPAWKYSRDSSMKYYRSSIPDLVQTLNYDPSIKMLVMHGYYDLVCPFHLTELDLANVGLTARIPVKNYEGGHMTYESEEARVPMKQELDKFYTQPVYPAPAVVNSQSVSMN